MMPYVWGNPSHLPDVNFPGRNLDRDLDTLEAEKLLALFPQPLNPQCDTDDDDYDSDGSYCNYNFRRKRALYPFGSPINRMRFLVYERSIRILQRDLEHQYWTLPQTSSLERHYEALAAEERFVMSTEPEPDYREIVNRELPEDIMLHQPATLGSMALKSFARYVSDLGVHLVNTVRTSDAAFDTAEHSRVCKRLQAQVRDRLPARMICSLSLEILKELDRRYFEVDRRLDLPDCSNTMQQVVDIAVSPNMTELAISHKWRYVTYYVSTRMNQLSNLRTFKFPNSVGNGAIRMKPDFAVAALLRNASHVHHLETLVCHTLCNDHIVKAVLENCPQLRCLDVYLSVAVTDSCVDCIEMSARLEELDIAGTGISDKGRMRILKGIRGRLKHYSVSELRETEISKIAKYCPHLTELSGSLPTGHHSYTVPHHSHRFIAYELLNLEKSNSLSTLRIFNHDKQYTYHLHMIQCVGFNLTTLFLQGNAINVVVVAKNCPSLVNLCLRSKNLAMSEPDVPALKYLENLTVHTNDSLPVAKLLFGCTSLKFLEICAPDFFFSRCVAKVLEQNELSDLQELRLGSPTGIVYPRVIQAMTARSSYIVSCKVFGKNTDEIKAVYRNFPGVQVDPRLWKLCSDVFSDGSRSYRDPQQYRSPHSFEYEYL